MIGNGGACINPLPTNTTNRLTVDQRGLPRGATCDIGAFQAQPITVTGNPQITGTPVVGHTLTCVTGSFLATDDGQPHGFDRRAAVHDPVREQRGTGLAVQHLHRQHTRPGALDHLHDGGCRRVRSGPGDERPGAGAGDRQALAGLPGAVDVGRDEDQERATGGNDVPLQAQHPRQGDAAWGD
jgi:hypothetical protein